MLSFDNTEIAFLSKSDKDLNRSYWLFKLVGSPRLVKAGKFFMELALKIGFPIKGIIKATIFRQFVGGENIEECGKIIADLGKFRIGTILDYSVEGKSTEADFNSGCGEIIQTILRGKADSNIPFSVFKVTGLAPFSLLEKVSAGSPLSAAEEVAWKKALERVEQICRAAHEHKVPVFIDAEESWIQDAIDQMADAMMEKFNKEEPIVYNTYQLYRHDRLAFLKTSLERAKAGGYFLGAKLVRGAYMEKERARAEKLGYPSPIHADKASTDTDFDLALAFCMEHLDRIGFCAGTHNERSSMTLAKMLDEKGVSHADKRVYFSQLLGMSDHISFNLADAGYNVAKYVPYGPVKEVLPYLIRIAMENTSVKGQTGRELGLIIREKQRRKEAKKKPD
jgi:proline dehydrogenase